MGSGSVSPQIPPGRPRTNEARRFSYQRLRHFFRYESQWALVMRAIKTIELLVPVSSTRCRAYTPGLSTWWSTTALKGELVSRWVSRLDAFSDYPVRT